MVSSNQNFCFQYNTHNQFNQMVTNVWFQLLQFDYFSHNITSNVGSSIFKSCIFIFKVNIWKAAVAQRSAPPSCNLEAAGLSSGCVGTGKTNGKSFMSVGSLWRPLHKGTAKRKSAIVTLFCTTQLIVCRCLQLLRETGNDEHIKSNIRTLFEIHIVWLAARKESLNKIMK